MFRPSLKIFPVFRALNEVIGNMLTSAALTLLKSGSYKLNLNVLTVLTMSGAPPRESEKA